MSFTSFSGQGSREFFSKKARSRYHNQQIKAMDAWAVFKSSIIFDLPMLVHFNSHNLDTSLFGSTIELTDMLED